jgi:hypothetical protein
VVALTTPGWLTLRVMYAVKDIYCDLRGKKRWEGKESEIPLGVMKGRVQKEEK